MKWYVCRSVVLISTAMTILFVQVKHERCAQAYCSYQGVVSRAVLVGHDTLPRLVLVYQDMIRRAMWGVSKDAQVIKAVDDGIC